MTSKTDAAREAARQRDGKFGEQHRSEPEEQLVDTPTMEYYRHRNDNAGWLSYVGLNAERDTRQQLIAAHVRSWYPTATTARFTWEDGDIHEPSGVRMGAVLDADGNVLADTDSSESFEEFVNDYGFIECDDWKGVRLWLDEVEDGYDQYTLDLTQFTLEEPTADQLAAVKVQGLAALRSPGTIQLLGAVLAARPDLAARVEDMDLDAFAAMQRVAAEAAIAHLEG